MPRTIDLAENEKICVREAASIVAINVPAGESSQSACFRIAAAAPKKKPSEEPDSIEEQAPMARPTMVAPNA